MKFTQFLGYVFEGAFKAGFLVEKLAERDYQNFLEGLYAKLEEEYINRFPEEEGSEIFSLLGAVFEKLPYSPYDPPEETKLGGLFIDERTARNVYTKLAFNIGYAGGYLYGQKHRSVELKKYLLGEESSQIVWENADLIFLEKGTLHVIDFKASGIMGNIRSIAEKRKMSDKEIYIPFSNYGASTHLSLGYPKLEKFIEALLTQRDTLLRIDEVSVELKGILQLPIYAADFICREKANVEYVKIALFYPFQESFLSKLRVEEKEKLENYIEELREIYTTLKKKELVWAQVVKKAEINQSLLMQELKDGISESLQEIENRRRNPIALEVGNMEEVRRDARRRIKEFWEREESGILALLHSAGSGKTTGIRETILSSAGKHIVIYLAARKVIVERESFEVRMAVNGQVDKKNPWRWYGKEDVGFLMERENAKVDEVVHEGDSFTSPLRPAGILNRAITEVERAHDKFRRIWVFATIQSITNSRGRATSNHLRRLLNAYTVESYQITIILDEFLGHNNGLYAIKEVCSFASEFKRMGGKIKVFLLDANGFTPELIVGLLKEFQMYGVIPDGIILCNHRESMTWEYMGLPLYLYAKHGFPAREIVVYSDFIRVSSAKKDGVKKVAEYIRKTFNDRRDSTAFLFLQDKKMLVEISRKLEEGGISTLLATSTSRKSQERINSGDEDVILGTSSVSRGIDFKRPRKPIDYIYVVITDWGIEKNLVEIIQAISRARGDMETESRTKYLHLIYLIEDPKEYQIENLVNLLEFPDEKLLSLACISKMLRERLHLADVVLRIIRTFLESREGQEVLVPVPAQHETEFSHNKISELEQVFTYLTDISIMELKNAKYSQKIQELASIIESAIHIYTSDIRKDTSRIEYYHPYILIRNARVFMDFDNEKRKLAEELCEELKPVFDRHNRRIYEEILYFIKTVKPTERYTVPLLVPVYSLVFTEQALCRQDSTIKFTLGRRIGRGGADVLGGVMKLRTRCVNDGKSKEYSCIPLGEDYPYIEVLSGRFVYLPIEFIKSFWEVKDGVYR